MIIIIVALSVALSKHGFREKQGYLSL